jgi:hypothetical protein
VPVSELHLTGLHARHTPGADASNCAGTFSHRAKVVFDIAKLGTVIAPTSAAQQQHCF